MKIESLEIEARDSSVLLTRSGSREFGKGRPPKPELRACVFPAGPSENICRTVTNFCEALSNAVVVPYRFGIDIAVGSLNESDPIFYYHPKREKERKNVMKRIVCLMMALLMVMSMAACGSKKSTGVEDGVLTVGMECAYAPYNWM